MRVLVDGAPVPDAEASLSVFDWGVQRGYGCFEVLHSYGGRPFRLSAHLDRLAASAAALRIETPDRADLEKWILQQSEAGGDCLIRTYVTAGSRDPLISFEPRTVVIIEPVPSPLDGFRCLPLPAPWHSAGARSELTGAKTLSYAPNMRATMEAEQQGFDDALLLSRDGLVLEGPTLSVAWFTGNTLETPGLDLGILASITRAAVLEAAGSRGFTIAEGRYSLERVLEAGEVFAMSTVKEVTPVTALGDQEYEPGPLTAEVAAAFSELVQGELDT